MGGSSLFNFQTGGICVNVIKKEIILQYEVKGENLIFDDLRTLSLAMGTQSVSGNFHIFDIEKKENRYVVPIKAIRERYEKKKKVVEKQIEYLEIMKQIIDEVSK
jgi:hypothetical protein